MEHNINHSKGWIFIVAGLMLLPSAQQSGLAQINDYLYNNTSSKTGQEYAPAAGTEFGNQVILAVGGGSGQSGSPTWGLTAFSFEYNSGGAAVGSVVGSAVVSFYENTGPLVAGPGSQAPSTVLYTSPGFGLTASGPDGATAIFTGLNVIVPTTFTWTVTFNSANGATLGLDTYGPPTIGNAYNDIWQRTGASWELLAPNGTIQGNGTPAAYATFGAEFITYVPEPRAFALGLMSVAFFVVGCRASRRGTKGLTQCNVYTRMARLGLGNRKGVKNSLVLCPTWVATEDEVGNPEVRQPVKPPRSRPIFCCSTL
jgi:hypothetical protein